MGLATRETWDEFAPHTASSWRPLRLCEWLLFMEHVLYAPMHYLIQSVHSPVRWGPLLFPFTGETEAQINGVTDPDLPPEMWQRRELNQPVLRLIASPQATQGVRELSRSPRVSDSIIPDTEAAQAWDQ